MYQTNNTVFDDDFVFAKAAEMANFFNDEAEPTKIEDTLEFKRLFADSDEDDNFLGAELMDVSETQVRPFENDDSDLADNFDEYDDDDQADELVARLAAELAVESSANRASNRAANQSEAGPRKRLTFKEKQEKLSTDWKLYMDKFVKAYLVFLGLKQGLPTTKDESLGEYVPCRCSAAKTVRTLNMFFWNGKKKNGYHIMFYLIVNTYFLLRRCKKSRKL